MSRTTCSAVLGAVLAVLLACSPVACGGGGGEGGDGGGGAGGGVAPPARPTLTPAALLSRESPAIRASLASLATALRGRDPAAAGACFAGDVRATYLAAVAAEDAAHLTALADALASARPSVVLRTPLAPSGELLSAWVEAEHEGITYDIRMRKEDDAWVVSLL